MDLAAQFDELGFRKGDVIEIHEAVDEDFAIGECDGRTGSFPLAFVEIFEGEVHAEVQQEKPKNKMRWWEDEKNNKQSSSNGSNTSGYNASATYSVSNASAGYTTGKAYSASTTSTSGYSTTATYTSAKSSVSHSPQSHSYDTHRTASPYSDYTSSTSEKAYTQSEGGVTLNQQQQQVHYQRSDSHSPNTSIRTSYTAENTRSHDSELTPYGQVLFQFIAENANELTVLPNDIVNLIQHVDDQWIEGELNGKRGIFPASFIEVIVDCPWATSNTTVSNTQGDISQVSPSPQTEAQSIHAPIPDATQSQPDILNLKTFPPETYGLVLYDFNAETEQDLSLRKGDTVTLLHQMDDFWYEAEHDDGRVGFCPIDYIELITGMDTQKKTASPQPVSQSQPQLASPQPYQSPQPSPVQMSQSTISTSSVKPAKPPPPAKPKLQPKPNRMSLPADFETQSAPILPQTSQSSFQSVQAKAPSMSAPKVLPNLGPPPAIPSRAIDQHKGLTRSDTLPSPPVTASSSHAKPVVNRAKSVALDSELDTMIEVRII